MINLIKKPIVIIPAIIIIGSIIGGYIYFGKDNTPVYDYMIAERGDLIQEVSVTGQIKPAESVELAFEKSGKLSHLEVEVGNKVNVDQLLAGLNNVELAAQVAQAEAGVENARAQLQQYQAALETQQAKLAELKQGTRPEEIQIAETNVANNEKALADARTNLDNVQSKADSELAKARQAKVDAEVNLTNVTDKAGVDLAELYSEAEDILDDAYTKADDGVNSRTSGIFLAGSYKLSFITSNSYAQTQAESQKRSAEKALEDFDLLVTNLSSDYFDIDNALKLSEDYLVIIKDFLSYVNSTLIGATNLSQTTLDSYNANIYTARTNVNTVLSNIANQKRDIDVQEQTNQNNIDAAQASLNTAKAALTLQEVTNQSNISSAEASVNKAQNALASAQDELVLKKAGATSEQIRAQEAQVRQAEANVTSQQAQIKNAQANVQYYQAQIVKTILRSPIAGIVTKQHAKVGEIISANTPIISIISEAEFEIEAYIPEADIAKVKINDLAKVTVDAYSSDVVFGAKVIAIDPAETIIEGVATYIVTFQFIEEDERIKSGMTANIDILTDKRENIIAIPGRAVISRNGGKTVRIVGDNGAILEVAVKVGIRGSDGRIEILSGISEGDKVITFMEEK